MYYTTVITPTPSPNLPGRRAVPRARQSGCDHQHTLIDKSDPGRLVTKREGEVNGVGLLLHSSHDRDANRMTGMLQAASRVQQYCGTSQHVSVCMCVSSMHIQDYHAHAHAHTTSQILLFATSSAHLEISLLKNPASTPPPLPTTTSHTQVTDEYWFQWMHVTERYADPTWAFPHLFLLSPLSLTPPCLCVLMGKC